MEHRMYTYNLQHSMFARPINLGELYCTGNLTTTVVLLNTSSGHFQCF